MDRVKWKLLLGERMWLLEALVLIVPSCNSTCWKLEVHSAFVCTFEKSTSIRMP